MRRFNLTAAVVSVLLVASACGGGQTPGQEGGSELSGTIQIDGSSTVFPVSEAVAEEFQIENSNVRVTVGQSGTGGGFEKFCNGETDISDASRPIKDDEAQLCAGKQIEPVELKVAIDGLSVVVNKENDFVECLTVEELQNMWKPGSTVRTWQDVKPSWPAEEIKFYSPGADSGTFDYFTEEVVGEAAALRSGPEVQTSEDDNILVQGIQGDRYAIGYYGYAYFVENRDTQKAVAVDGGEGCVEPTDETIESGDYSPLSRPLFIYPSKTALQRPEVGAFVEFYLDNVGDLLADVGYIRVPDADLEAAKQAFTEAAGT